MNNVTPDKSLLTISYILFFVVLLVLFSSLAVPSTGKYDPSFAPFGFALAVAVFWQTVTLYHHRSNHLAWILMVFYSITFVGLIIYGLRHVA